MCIDLDLDPIDQPVWARGGRDGPAEGRAGELHGGRRAAGDARFLYDNECLWRARR